MFADLRTAHHERDRTELWQVAARKPLQVAPLVRVLAQHIELFPACAALHAERSPLDLAAAAGLACEQAAECEQVVDMTTLDVAYVSLPRSGVIVTFGERIDVQWRAGNGTIALSGPVGPLIELRHDEILGFRVVSQRPGVGVLRREYIGELAIEPGHIRYDEQLPVNANVMDRPLVPDEIEQLRRAMRLLRVCAPELFAEICQERITLVPLLPRPGLLRQSCSFRSAPGLVFLNLADPLEILDLLCHEYHHLKLFRAEECTVFVHEPSVPVVVPWRADTRNAAGLLHGIYVFFMCAWLLDAVFNRFRPSDRGVTRVVVFRACVEAALDELERSDCGLSPVAQLLVDEITAANRAGVSTLETAHPTVMKWAREAVDGHLSRAGGPDRTEPWFLGL